MLRADSQEKTTALHPGRGWNWLVQFLLIMLGVIVLAPPALPQDQLGTSWEVEEQNGFIARWDRKGNSNEFDMRVVRGSPFTAVVQVHIAGNQVEAQRWNSSSASGKATCTYTGTVSNEGIVEGTYFCPSGMIHDAPWRATIHGYTASSGVLIPGGPLGLINPAIILGGPVPPFVGKPSSSSRSLVHIKGTANEHDANLVAQELDRFPPGILQILRQRGIRIQVCRGSITEVYPNLRGQHPDGYPEGWTWDQITGHSQTSPPLTVTIAIVTQGDPHLPGAQEGSNSENTLFHETMHTIDYTESPPRHTSAAFRDAYDADFQNLKDNSYFNTRDDRALSEWYAESATRDYIRENYRQQLYPNTMRYWESNSVMRR